MGSWILTSRKLQTKRNRRWKWEMQRSWQKKWRRVKRLIAECTFFSLDDNENI